MRIVATSDWHCSLSNLDRCQIVLQQLLSIIKAEKCDHVLHLGDLKSQTSPVSVQVTNWLVYAVKEIVKLCPMLILCGNHDRAAMSDDSESHLPVMREAGADVFDQPGFYTLRLNKDWALRLMPFFRNQDAVRQALATKPPPAKHCILAFHATVTGCRQNVLGNKGEGIAAKDLRPEWYDFCVGGHIHFAQKIPPNIRYIGSAFACDWGEANTEHGFVLVDTDKKNTIWIPSIVPGWYDPLLPDFHSPKSWKDAHVRIHVPIKIDASHELAQARRENERKYPGAILHLVPDFQTVATPAGVDLKGTDAELLEKYFFIGVDLKDKSFTKEQATAFIQHLLPPGNLGDGKSLKLRRVTAKDVLCFEKVQLNLMEPGVTLVTGENRDWGPGKSNGAGKSTILGMVPLALFGKTPKGQQFDTWRRRGCQTDSHIQIDLDLPDGRPCSIHRGRNPGKLEVFVDGRDFTAGDANATQRVIEQLLGVTWEAVTNSVYIGQREIGTVLAGTDKQRKELFGQFLGLERFQRCEQAIRLRIRRNHDQDMEQVALIAGSDSALRECRHQLDVLQKQKKFVPAVEPDDIERLRQEAAKHRAAVCEIEKQLRVLSVELDDNQRKFEKWLDKTLIPQGQIELLQQQMENAVSVSGKCPLCGSKVSVSAMEKHTEELESQIESLQTAVDKYTECQRINREKRKDLFREKDDLEASKRSRETQTGTAESKIRVLEAVAKSNADLDRLLDMQETRERQILRELATRKLALEAVKEHADFLEFCLSVVGRGGLPSYLCAAVAPQLNRAAGRYSELFTDGEIQVAFKMSDGDIDALIENVHGGENLTDQSEGETRLAGLIVAFAIRETLVQHGLLVLDEPGEGLDAANCAAFAQGLETVARKFGTVFVTSHNPNLLANLDPDRHLLVIKESGISMVTEVPV